jgi:hypothetical protein
MFVEGKISHAEQEMLIMKDMKENELCLPWKGAWRCTREDKEKCIARVKRVGKIIQERSLSAEVQKA